MKWDAIAKMAAVAVSALVAVAAALSGRRKDKVAERTGALANGRAGVEQAFALLDETIDNLRDDKRDMREDARLDRAKAREDLEACRAAFAAYVRDHS